MDELSSVVLLNLVSLQLQRKIQRLLPRAARPAARPDAAYSQGNFVDAAQTSESSSPVATSDQNLDFFAVSHS